MFCDCFLWRKKLAIDPVVWNETSRWLLLVFLVIIISFLYAVTLWYNLRVKQTTRTKRADPFFRALLLTFAVIAITGTLEVTTLFDKGATKKAVPLFFLFFIGSLMVYWYVGREKRTLSPQKQITEMLYYCRDFYGAKIDRTLAYNPFLKVFKEIYDPTTNAITGSAVLSLQSFDDNTREYLVRIDAFSGKLLFITENPPLVQLHQLTGDRLATRNNTFKNSFDEYDEPITNKENKNNGVETQTDKI